jgi:hypothetical protein
MSLHAIIVGRELSKIQLFQHLQIHHSISIMASFSTVLKVLLISLLYYFRIPLNSWEPYRNLVIQNCFIFLRSLKGGLKVFFFKNHLSFFKDYLMQYFLY